MFKIVLRCKLQIFSQVSFWLEFANMNLFKNSDIFEEYDHYYDRMHFHFIKGFA